MSTSQLLEQQFKDILSQPSYNNLLQSQPAPLLQNKSKRKFGLIPTLARIVFFALLVAIIFKFYFQKSKEIADPDLDKSLGRDEEERNADTTDPFFQFF